MRSQLEQGKTVFSHQNQTSDGDFGPNLLFFNDLIQPTAYYLTQPVLFSYPALEMSTFYGKNVLFYVKIKA